MKSCTEPEVIRLLLSIQSRLNEDNVYDRKQIDEVIKIIKRINEQ